MKQNMGSIDRVIRIFITFTITILYLTDQITGVAAMVLSLFAAIFILTSFLGFCPLYVPLKLSTKKEPKNLSVNSQMQHRE